MTRLEIESIETKLAALTQLAAITPESDVTTWEAINSETAALLYVVLSKITLDNG